METVKAVMDFVSVATLAAVWAGYIPSVATVLTCAWISLRIYESQTVQRWLGRPPLVTKGEPGEKGEKGETGARGPRS